MPNMTKKPRLDDGTSSMVEVICHGTRAEFDAGLEGIATQEELTTLHQKIRKMESWVLEGKLKLQREDRARRKSQDKEELRAIYQVQTTGGSSTNNSRPYLTIELATALLDSGFLSPEETGRLCLLTGKFFVSGLDLAQYDLMWKNIFEAKFCNSHYALSSLYQSHKFMQVLTKKGYEWMVRQFFSKRIPASSESCSVLPAKEYPKANLDGENMLFILLLENTQEGTTYTMKAVVVDEDKTVDTFVSSTCRLAVPFDETMKQMKEMVDNKKTELAGSRWEREWVDFPREYLRFSLLAFRLDTYECTKLVETDKFECDIFLLGRYRVDMIEQEIPLDRVGKELLDQIVYFGEDTENVVLQLLVSWHILSGESVRCATVFRINSNDGVFRDGDEDEPGIDLYKVLDYGINWN